MDTKKLIIKLTCVGVLIVGVVGLIVAIVFGSVATGKLILIILGCVFFAAIGGLIIAAIVEAVVVYAKKHGMKKAIANLFVGIGIASCAICAILAFGLMGNSSRPEQNVVIEEADGSASAKHVSIYPGESVNIVFYKGYSVESKWSSEGFILYFDDYYDSDGKLVQLPLADPKRKDWDDTIYTQYGDEMDPFEIRGSIELPDTEVGSMATLTGTIRGKITYPAVRSEMFYEEKGEEISVPVIVDLLPMDEEYRQVVRTAEMGKPVAIIFFLSMAEAVAAACISAKFTPKRTMTSQEIPTDEAHDNERIK